MNIEELAGLIQQFKTKHLDPVQTDLAGFRSTQEQMRKDLDDLGTRLNRKTPGGYLPGASSIGERFTSTPEFVEYQKAKGWLSRRDLRLDLELPAVKTGLQGQPFDLPSSYIPFPAPATLPTMGIQGLLPNIPVSTDNVLTTVEDTEASSFTADYQAHYGDKKKASSMVWKNVRAMICTIAHYIKVPQQTMDDAPFLAAQINGRLLNGLAWKVELELANGTGSVVDPVTLPGVLGLATPLAAPGTGDTIIDAALGAKIQISQASPPWLGFRPNGYVFAPSAWSAVQGQKNAMGEYLVGSPSGSVGGPQSLPAMQLWGLPVVLSQALEGTALFVCGDWTQANFFTRQTATIQLATQNEDDFLKNLVALRAEERCTAIWYYPEAFVVAPVSGGLAATEEQHRDRNTERA